MATKTIVEMTELDRQEFNKNYGQTSATTVVVEPLPTPAQPVADVIPAPAPAFSTPEMLPVTEG